MLVGAPVLLLLSIKETVLYRPDENLYRPLKNNNLESTIL
jgi:hypothetical protein